MNFETILRNKVFCRMFGLVVIEIMTPSGHLSNINEMIVGLRVKMQFDRHS